MLTLKNYLQGIINSNNLIFDQNIGARDAFTMYLINISDYLILQNRFKDAEQQLKLASYLIQDYYIDRNVLNMLGVCYIHQNKLKEAEKLYQNLLKGYPEDFWYLYSLGMINMKSGKLNKAKNYLEKSIILNKDFAESRFALKKTQLLLYNKKND